jgi:hypothetical protein
MSEPTGSDLIMGGGVPAAKFDDIGTIVKGQIVAVDTGQQRDFKTKEPLFWGPDRRPSTTVTDKPVMQAIITVQTDQRDPGIDGDDGQRRIYVGGRNIRDAVRDAVVKSGARDIRIGGTLAVKYTAGAGGTGDPKQFIAEYAPPAAGLGLLDGGPENITQTAAYRQAGGPHAQQPQGVPTGSLI